MSSLRSPEPVKLIIGMFSPRRESFAPVAVQLADAFGAFDMISPWMPFDQTDYYAAEMGGPLFRRMVAFAAPMDPGRLPAVKRFCHDLEQTLMAGAGRSVNIDPGYLNRSRFVLATGKDFTHRIYIGESVYADLTLVVAAGRLSPLPWTYPDYRQPAMLRFLERARSKYLEDLAGRRRGQARPTDEKENP
ncbi:MAG: DUF4416 family protein [Pseudomonadota bacterium]